MWNFGGLLGRRLGLHLTPLAGLGLEKGKGSRLDGCRFGVQLCGCCLPAATFYRNTFLKGSRNKTPPLPDWFSKEI